MAKARMEILSGFDDDSGHDDSSAGLGAANVRGYDGPGLSELDSRRESAPSRILSHPSGDPFAFEFGT